MSATYGYLRGYAKNGNPVQKNLVTARGHASMWAKVQTWRTAAEVTISAEGEVYIEVKRSDGVVLYSHKTEKLG